MIQKIDLKGWTVCEVNKLDSWGKQLCGMRRLHPLMYFSFLFWGKTDMSETAKLIWASAQPLPAANWSYR